jgi:N-acetylglucosaminyl-diphospho-decaprenol L-rhamnosyltransferase
VLPHDALPGPGVIPRILAEGTLHPKAGLLRADVGDQASPTIDPFMGPLPGPSAGPNGFESVDYPHGTLMLIRRAAPLKSGCSMSATSPTTRKPTFGIRVRGAGWEVGLIRGAMVENPGQGNVTAIVD